MHAICSAKDTCAAANEVEVAENVWTASMMAKKSRGDIGICCGGGGVVEDEPAKSVGDRAVDVTGVGGSDEAGSVGHGAACIGTGEGETETGGEVGTEAPSIGDEVGTEAPSIGTAWEGCSTAGRSLARSSST